MKYLADTLIKQAEINKKTQSLLINSLTQSNDKLAALHGKLIDTLPELAVVTRSSGRQLDVLVGPLKETEW